MSSLLGVPMSFRNLPGLCSIVALAGALTACAPQSLPAKATVSMVDRKCKIIESTTRQVDDPRAAGHKIEAQEMRSLTDDCSTVEEWAEVRAKRTRKVQGTAVFHVDYQAPQDGSFHSATLTFTGRDDEFYELGAGDSIDILVAKNDPTKIRKA